MQPDQRQLRPPPCAARDAQGTAAGRVAEGARAESRRWLSGSARRRGGVIIRARLRLTASEASLGAVLDCAALVPGAPVRYATRISATASSQSYWQPSNISANLRQQRYLGGEAPRVSRPTTRNSRDQPAARAGRSARASISPRKAKSGMVICRLDILIDVARRASARCCAPARNRQTAKRASKITSSARAVRARRARAECGAAPRSPHRRDRSRAAAPPCSPFCNTRRGPVGSRRSECSREARSYDVESPDLWRGATIGDLGSIAPASSCRDAAAGRRCGNFWSRSLALTRFRPVVSRRRDLQPTVQSI